MEIFKNGPRETCGRQPLKNLKCSGLLNSLGARDGFTRTIQKVRPLQFVNQTKCTKKTVVSCDFTYKITLGTKPKMLIFTLYLPHNLQSRVLAFRKFM